MARELKSIFARRADKRSAARRSQNGGYPSRVGLTVDQSGKIISSFYTEALKKAEGQFRESEYGDAEQPDKSVFQNDVFSTETDYDRSVASVIARIKNGEVRPIEPDSE